LQKGSKLVLTEDRDWHVIIEDRGLAHIFTAYLNYDYQSAAQWQQANPAAAEAIRLARAKGAAEANPPPPPTFPAAKTSATAAAVPAKEFNVSSVRVTPLLTPDKLPRTNQGQYLSNIMKLIGDAQSSICIQLQYIESSSGKGDAYDELLKAISERVSAGVNVRLIESANYAEKWIEKMKAAGADLTANIRLQPNVHNKGFIVDDKIVVVSSQNFSPAGVSDNRDAGVLIESPEIAQYFKPIFEADWKKAKPAVASGAGPVPKKAGAKASGKTGRTRTPAKKQASTKKKARTRTKAAKGRGRS
jgi:phosphatidylserine/phosphatidylglycerophosphate/cardiolipin synthase-like enzyme